MYILTVYYTIIKQVLVSINGSKAVLSCVPLSVAIVVIKNSLYVGFSKITAHAGDSNDAV